MIVTRFAPSPTGFLHIGHAYAAVFAHDAAMREGGRFLLRIEDIDASRCRPEFEAAIKEDLLWLGAKFEEPVRRQSEHFPEYASAVAALDAMGLLYPCFCTRKDIAEEIARAAIAPQASEMDEGGPTYPGTCRKLPPEIRSGRVKDGMPYALRLDTGKAVETLASPLTFEETGKGPRGERGLLPAEPLRHGDIVLARKDMPASYHLAVVFDDALQGVTLVTRGEDLFAATHVQRLLQALLGLPVPRYRHHRLILDGNGKKFSKRDRSVTLKTLREAGMSPADIRARLDL